MTENFDNLCESLWANINKAKKRGKVSSKWKNDPKYRKQMKKQAAKISKEGIHDPVRPGILKRQTTGKLTCTKARALKAKQKNKGNNTAKAAQRYLNYHCEDTQQCPAATQNLKLNTQNRDATIKEFNYGPLNVAEPGDYWEKIAKYWKTTTEAAKKSLCGNCVAFDISPRMDECMPGETSDNDGRLGYCWMHHFKCHSARSCHTWAKGGPITEDEKSLDWQKRNSK